MPVKITVELCPLCGAHLPPHGRHGRVGMLVELGHSDGGWGHREHDVTFSDEVCRDCYTAVMPRFRVLWQELVAARRDVGKTFVVVTDPLGRTEVK